MLSFPAVDRHVSSLAAREMPRNTTALDYPTEIFLVDRYWRHGTANGIKGPMTDGHMILCLLFRATFLQIRASAQITTLGSFDSALDGISFELPWYIDSTNSSSDYVVAQLDLPLDDHQLFLSVPTSPQKPIQVELSVDASQPDPRPAFYGVTATQLPLGDIIDDASPQLLYSSDVGWDHRTSGVLGWGGTHSTTYESGSWFQVTFAGSAIWFVIELLVGGRPDT
ncbi:hypothetical protein PIIN_08639 [Serendipita indica DSM 11827]|uniref:Uncharacterized protein n=1 Tax=Serendipita indica (strain DSM 11827) TaxID=1109443 RepID=G4TTP5_SERID|nr:hypothetical protein PIIN_08639 [Serendipita indica DSM 11827]